MISHEEIRKLIVDKLLLNVDPSSFNNEDPIKEALGLDSIQALELVTALEETYQVTIEDEKIYLILKNVNTIVDFLEEQLKNS